MAQTSDVRRELGRYLAGHATLRQLVIWLAENAVALREAEEDGPALAWIRTLELAIGEFTSQHLDRAHLDLRFREVMTMMPDSETKWVDVTRPAPRSSSSARTRFAEACV